MIDGMTRRSFMMTAACAAFSPHVLAGPTRSSIAARGVSQVEPLHSDYTAADYVQNGLIAMWDGIENAGLGIHDPSVTGWYDLAGNLGVIESTGMPVWTDNAYRGASGVSFDSSSTVIGDIINSGVYTLEICVYGGTRQNTNGGIIGIGLAKRQFWIYEAPNTASYFFDVIQSQQVLWSRPADNTRGSPFCLQFTYDGTVATFRSNGSVSQTRKNYSKPVYTSDGFRIGRIGTTFGCALADIHRLSIYSRALTAGEVATNYAIDKERFNLP